MVKAAGRRWSRSFDPAGDLCRCQCRCSMATVCWPGLRSSRLARLRQIPVLMIAGDNEEANQRARALGASDFIVGNIGASELLARIDSHCAWPRRRTSSAKIRNATPCTRIPDCRPASTSKSQAAQASHMPCARESGEHSDHGLRPLRRAARRARRRSGQRVAETFRKHAGTKVRKEDSLGHYSGSDLAVVSPGTPYPACEAFANRLREAFAVANIAVHGQRLDLSVSIGVANTPVDRLNSASSLLTSPLERLKTAQQAGGNRVVACATSRPPRPAPRLGHAIDLIKAGHANAVIPHLVRSAKKYCPSWNCWKGS
jgi:two-component system cell cycle response regulator